MGIITLPEIGKHITFCGTTGSGKTFLAQEMLKSYDRYFIFDTQDSIKLEDAVKLTSPENLKRKLRFFDKIRYVPELQYRTKEIFNLVTKTLFTSKYGKKRIIYIDEIFHLGFGISFPDWLSRGISTARQKKISLWTASQRPTNIPMAILTESSRIYLFYLSYAEDIKKVSKFTRDERRFLEVVKELKYDYSFIEIDRIKGEWKKMGKLSI